MFKDFMGAELVVGDRVAYQIGGRYPGLDKAWVHSFTPLMVRLSTKRGSYVCRTVNPEHLIKTFNQQE